MFVETSDCGQTIFFAILGFEKESDAWGGIDNEKTSWLGALVGAFLRSDAFPERTRQRTQSFTRERKVGFLGVVSIILNMVRKTTQLIGRLCGADPSGR